MSAWKRPICEVVDCTRPSTVLMGARCTFHQILRDAQWLSEEDFTLLRSELAELHVLTPDERGALQREGAIRALSHDSRVLEMTRQRALKYGATEEQIEAAIAEGRVKAAES